MTRSDKPEPAEPAGSAKAKPAPESTRDLPMAGLLASSPSKAIAANEFDPREAFYPKTLLTAEDLRGGGPAAAPAASTSAASPAAVTASSKSHQPRYLPDPEAERSSPLRFLAVLVLIVAAGGAYWYFFMDGAPSIAVTAPKSRSGAIEPAAPGPAPGTGVTHTKGGAAPGETPPPASPAQAEPPRRVEAPASSAPAPAPAPASASAPASAPAPAKSCPPQVAALGLCTP